MYCWRKETRPILPVDYRSILCLYLGQIRARIAGIFFEAFERA